MKPVGFDERWLQPGGIVPVDEQTTWELVREIQRLRSLLPEATGTRDAIIEECAKVCDGYYKVKHAASIALAKKERFESSDDAGAKSVGARECAALIRDLKDKCGEER